MKTNCYFFKKHRINAIVLSIITALLAITVPSVGADAQKTSAVVPVGANFSIASNTGQGVIGGKPGIAFDGTNFFVPYLQGTDIYARRVTPQGVVLDTTSISISVGLNDSAEVPSVEFDGVNYLVVWVAIRDNSSELYGALVTPSGGVLNPGGVNITNGGNPMMRMSCISFDGTNYLVVWRAGNNQIYATRVSPDGTNLDSTGGFPVAASGTSYYPSVAFDGSNYLVVWHDSRNTDNGLDIYGARITPQGVVLDPEGFVICDEPMNQDASYVGFDGTNYLVVWYYWPQNNNAISGSFYGARVSPSGEVLDKPAFQIADRARGGNPKAVCGGENCLVVWNTDYPNIGNKYRLSDVWGRRISPNGTILDQQAIPIATAFGHQFGPIAGYGGGRYLVAWNESTGRESVGGYLWPGFGAAEGFPSCP